LVDPALTSVVGVWVVVSAGRRVRRRALIGSRAWVLAKEGPMSHRRRPLAAALALNTVALVGEIGAGVPAKSRSLVMDGVHNVSDEVALAFLVLAYTLRVGLSGRFLRTANL